MNQSPSGKDEKRFHRIVMDDFRRGDFKRTVRRDLGDLYAFYLDEEARGRLASMPRLKRWILMVGWLAKSLFLNLTPTRRIFLLISIWCFIQGGITFGLGGSEVDLNLKLFAFLILLLILMLELKDKLLAKDELEVGRAVQIALLPTDQPALPGWDIWLYTRPANDVGGDLVDYISLRDRRLGLALGDVSGKGLGAALLMGKLQATLRALATEFASLAELGARINGIFCRDRVPDRYTTLVYLEIEENSGTVRILNAGHLPPIHAKPGDYAELPPVAQPLGLFPDIRFEEQRLELDSGDSLLLYSDGITEAINNEGEFFGDDRLRELIPRIHGRPAKEGSRILLSEVTRFAGDERPSDDVSLILLRRL